MPYAKIREKRLIFWRGYDILNSEYTKVAKDGFVMGRRELEFMLACETTGRERYMALALLSAHYPVDLYSTDVEKK